MKYNDILYKHIHPTLISKELFDECQAVKQGRRKAKYKRTQKPFVLKGMLKCQHCGCAYSPELKKGKYVYMRPTKSQGDCNYCYHLNENKILSQIEDVLKGMEIPKNILVEIGEELKKSSNKVIYFFDLKNVCSHSMLSNYFLRYFDESVFGKY